MSFLAPLFLLGALAVALPILFHLIRRTTRQQTVFSSLMFLRPSPPRLSRRSRLQDLLLLALRCAVLGLLALGFARPFFKNAATAEPAGTAPRRVVLLVDASASMQRENLWDNARDRLAAHLRQAGPADQLALFTFDDQVRRLVTFEQWQATPVGERAALALSRLAAAPPGWAATSLGHALIQAAEALDESDTSTHSAAALRQIVLITDLQEGSDLIPLQAFEWPQNVQLLLETLPVKRTSNAALQRLPDPPDLAPNPDAAGPRIRVVNAPDSSREQFLLGWRHPAAPGFTGTPLEVYVPPGQSRIVFPPAPPTHSAPAELVLQGDDHEFDNRIFILPPVTARATVLYFGNEPETDPKQPLYFLQRALQETRRQSLQVQAIPPDAPFPEADLDNAALVVISAPLPETGLQALARRVQQGKTLLVLVRDPSLAPALAALLSLERLEFEETAGSGYAMLADIDFQHPLFAPFADPRYSDFTKIHFWKHRRLDPTALPNARLLARFDNGDPALVELSLNQGRILILTAGWHPADSQLALSSKFVPLLYSLLDYSGLTPPPQAQYFVGDTLNPRALVHPTNATLTIRTPTGTLITLPEPAEAFSDTRTPGIYRVDTVPPVEFAVNLPAAESRTAPLPTDLLERFGAPIQTSRPDTTRHAQRHTRLQHADLENRQKVWRWLIVSAIILLLAESWLAGWLARRSSTPNPVTS